jgi:dolichol-phosphate mannosyltransferase
VANKEETELCYSQFIQSPDPYREVGQKNQQLSILLPVYDEEDIIEEVVTSYYNEIVTKIPSKLIIAEDGSDDQTPQILRNLSKKLPIFVYSDLKRKGFAGGVRDGLKKCSNEWVFFSDSDGQYNPSDFWNLWENRQGYDMIIGHKVQRSDSMHRIILSRAFHNLTNILFGLRLEDCDSGFRLIRQEVIQSVLDNTTSLKYSFFTEFTIRAHLYGYRIREIPISHISRENGKTRIFTKSKIPIITLKQLQGIGNLLREAKRIKSQRSR